MNQEKIGKFISECRREKKMTQQDLADKLGVTDKAISKWENGRSMMDISMLKPLSECLGVTVMEIINGEKISEEEKDLKTDETIENTLGYANDKIKKVVNRIVLILLVITILLLISFGIIAYKFICAEHIYVNDQNLENDEKIVNALSMKKSMEIYNKKIDDNEYLIYNNLKIKNVFEGFLKEEYLEYPGNIHFSKYDENNKYIGGIWIDSKPNLSYFDEFKSSPYLFDADIDIKIREEFLLKNNINNDIDLFKYISDNYYNYWRENDFLTDSIKWMRENYMFNVFVSSNFSSLESGSIIFGDYTGYILDFNHKIDGYSPRIVSILQEDKVVCIFSFFGEEITTDEYIIDLLSTLVIK